VNTVAFVLRAVQLAREAGLTVTFEPGWETRGNGYAANYVGFLAHHTGTASSLANPFPTHTTLRVGRSDLQGPLCNSAGPADGSVHVMAALPANHAGASGGRSMGPLPVTGLFNPRVWGHEIDYAGTVPMRPEQYRAATVWARCVLTALTEVGQIPRFDPERVRLHAETSVTGKWDPGDAPGHTIDGPAFRTAVATPPTIEEDEEEDMKPYLIKSARFPLGVLKLGDDFVGLATAEESKNWKNAGAVEVWSEDVTVLAFVRLSRIDETAFLAEEKARQDAAAAAGITGPEGK
jgi:hypothetical protein